MSELLVKNPPNALIVSAVDPGSPAERAGIRIGDLIREINARPILDILDYQFHSAESVLRFVIDRDSRIVRLTVRLSEDETPGLTFQHDLGDKIHTCNNKCVF